MISKSSARWFFILGVGSFSLIFLWLTVDTIRQIPARTNADKLTAEVASGKAIWDDNNCMGCHTIMGEGAYYAPELTKVTSRRSEAWLKLFLKDPQAMFPGERKMVNYDFNDKEISDLISFFKWIERVNTNGFPKEPPLKKLIQGNRAIAAETNSAGKVPLIYDEICAACHQLDGQGGKIGPALDRIGERLDKDQLAVWLRDPAKVKPGTTMPNLGLSETNIEALSGFLSQLK